MTVKDLIEELQKHSPYREIFIVFPYDATPDTDENFIIEKIYDTGSETKIVCDTKE